MEGVDFVTNCKELFAMGIGRRTLANVDIQQCLAEQGIAGMKPIVTRGARHNGGCVMNFLQQMGDKPTHRD
jgi:hypothetical protein